MNTYISEKEQIDQLKRLWKQYGAPLIAGVVIASIIVFGWRFWQSHRLKIVGQASILYEQVLVNFNSKDNAAVQSLTEDLMNKYSSTAYSQAAALILAKQEIEQKKYLDADINYQWAFNHGKSTILKELARIRDARVLVEEKKPELALAVLSKIEDKSFYPAVNEIKGDIFQTMGKDQKAREAYSLALQELPKGEINRPILKMKLVHVGGSIKVGKNT